MTLPIAVHMREIDKVDIMSVFHEFDIPSRFSSISELDGKVLASCCIFFPSCGQKSIDGRHCFSL